MVELADIDPRVRGKERGLPSPYPLIWHGVDAAAAASVLWDGYLSRQQRAVIAAGLGLPESEACRVVAFLAGLHDLGKCTAGFQRLCGAPLAEMTLDGYEDPPGGGSDHAADSQLLAYSLLRDIGFADGRAPSRTPAYRGAQALGGHHGRFQFGVDLGYMRDPLATVPHLAGVTWHRQRSLITDALHQVLGGPPPPVKADAPGMALVVGLIILADWLVSQESFLVSQLTSIGNDTGTAAINAHYARTIGMMPAVISDAGLGRPVLRDLTFPEVFSFSPNALQRSLEEELFPKITGAGLLVIAAAPGEGKTEAALRTVPILGEAAGASGCFFALPTMATTDAMYRRVREFLRRTGADPISLTLLHGMAWLSPLTEGGAASDAVDEVLSDGDPTSTGRSRGVGSSVTGTQWLRTGKRGPLADWGTGTLDQALLSVLPVPHNTLRMLGISRKVVVVDEAHAYDSYTQHLLRRLLVWLGRFGCPVILLSATLPSSVSRSLAEAYLRGAGHDQAGRADLEVAYPGWLFVPADGSPAVRPSAEAGAAMAIKRPHDLTVRMEPVRHETARDLAPSPGSRLAAVRRSLAVIGAEGGCGAVVCNTVGDAQDTFLDLADWAAEQPTRPTLFLLHSRFPARQRERITATLAGLFGKNAKSRGTDADDEPVRPSAAIVVATQIIEQSLDLDFDLMVSDLAPMALLLQRAGRCYRHPRTDRPHGIDGPALVVLDPVGVDGQHASPPKWGKVYSRHLLRQTREVLVARGAAPITIPGDVQHLVEQVYCTGPKSFLHYDEQAQRAHDEHEGARLAEQGLAEIVAVPEPNALSNLQQLSHRDVIDDRVSTRLGAESRRLVPCFIRPDGTRWLDPSATGIPLPENPRGARFTRDELTLIMEHSVPVRQDEVAGAGSDGSPHAPPPRWREHFLLGDLLLLPHAPADSNGYAKPLGELPFRIDQNLGLRKRKVSDPAD